jgi:hypothetical protein
MASSNRSKCDDVRQPGMRSILESMHQIEEEAPGLIDKAITASLELAKRRNGGHFPQ